MITIVGLGIAAGDLTLDAAQALTSGARVLLRTARVPAADWLRARGASFEALDALYEETEDFDEVNAALAAAVLAAAEGGDAVYAVPGSGGLLDESVCAVRAAAQEAGVPVRFLPGVGLYERAAGEAGGLADACVLSGIDVPDAQIDVRRPLIVCEFADRVAASEAKLTLLEHYPAEFQVCWNGKTIALEALDRQKRYDHLCTLVVPPLPLTQAQRFDFAHLLEIVRRLRAPGGCPWDREQTHESLKQDLLEEAYEVLDAVDSGEAERLADELGDLLLHIAMQAEIGREHGEFSAADVTSAICEKMIRRHPHVFGEARAENSEEVLRRWEEIKKGEKGLQTQVSVMRDVPRALPALVRAAKVQKKARDVGFDWDDPLDALQKVREETEEVREAFSDPEALPGELGDLLFAVVNVCRMKKAPPELVLSAATEKFIRRFASVEAGAAAQGRKLTDMTLAEMDRLWDEAKAREREKTQNSPFL